LILVAEVPGVVRDERQDAAALGAEEALPAAVPLGGILAARVAVLPTVILDETEVRTTVRARKGYGSPLSGRRYIERPS